MQIGYKLYEDLTPEGREAFEALQLEMALTCEANGWCMEDGCDEDGKRYLIINPPVEPTLDELKTAKLAQVDAWTANKITGGFVSTCFNGIPVKYDTDRDTQLTMTKARANCEGERFTEAFPDGMGVRGYEQTGFNDEGNPIFSSVKTVYNFLPEHIITWDEDFSLFLAQCKYEGWIKQAEVDAAESKEELDAIVLD